MSARRGRDVAAEKAAGIRSRGAFLRELDAAVFADVFTIIDALNPRTPRCGDGRTREGKAYGLRWIGVFLAYIDLTQAGLLQVVREADGDDPDLLAVSSAGRRCLRKLSRSQDDDDLAARESLGAAAQAVIHAEQALALRELLDEGGGL